MINMDGNEWKEKLEKGFAELTPDCWDEISSAISDGCITETMIVGDHRKKARRRIPALVAAAAVFLFAAFLINDLNTVCSVLYIDVNPSVCININKSGKVLSVGGINDEGAKVAEAARTASGNSRDLEKTVSCVIAEIDREGYFSEGTVDVLVSLRYSDREDNASLETACKTIEEYASTNDMKSNLISQSFAGTEAIEKGAAEMGISDGKYEFISKLVKEDKLEKDAMSDMAEKSMADILDNSASKKEQKSDLEEPDPNDGSEGNVNEAESQDGQESDGDSSVTENNSSKENKGDKVKDKKPKKEKKNKKKSENKSGNKDNNKNKEKAGKSSDNSDNKGKENKNSKPSDNKEKKDNNKKKEK